MASTKGTCVFCGKDYTGGGLSRHLPACSDRNAAIEAQNAKKSAKETLYHLRVYDAYDADFWLHLEMRGSAKLKDLDSYLRAIWLECCGHLSQFSQQAWDGNEFGMHNRVDKIFSHVDSLVHIYDFGSSSKTNISILKKRQGAPLSKNPIFLMARNNPPQYPCAECGKPAEYLSLDILYEEGDFAGGVFCEAHIEDNVEGDYGDPIPLLNSPRVGMCGYAGPDEPPY